MKRVIFLVFVLVFVLAGCHPDSLKKLDIPEDGYLRWFSPVESAVLYVNDTQRQIAADDPRLIRVLNFLAYSADSMLGSLTQGVIFQSEIEQYDFSAVTRLEVTFSVDAEANEGFCNHPKILVCGDTYFLYMNSETYASGNWEPCAERHWPYVDLAPEGAKRSDQDLSLDGDYWLDILKYCGF